MWQALAEMGLDVALVAGMTRYADWLEEHKQLEPDWTWIEVALGTAACLLHSAAHGATQRGDWRDQQLRVVMQRRRWPDGAEMQRKDAIAAIRTARDEQRRVRELLMGLDQLLRRTLHEPLAHDMISDMRTAIADAGEQLADAERFLVLARSGETEE